MKWKYFLWAVLLVPACAQASLAQDAWADLTRDLVARILSSGKKRVVVSPKFSCSEKKCNDLEWYFAAKVSEELSRTSGQFEVATPQQMEPLLRAEGFQPIDYYEPLALGQVARKLDVLFLSGSVKPVRDAVEVEFLLQRAPGFRTLHKMKITFARPINLPTGIPLCDPDSGVCIAGLGGITEPECGRCPNPAFTQEAINRRVQGIVLMLVTITVQGRVTEVSLVKGIGHGLDERAVATVGKWHLKPAHDASGKPVATRVTVEIAFRQ